VATFLSVVALKSGPKMMASVSHSTHNRLFFVISDGECCRGADDCIHLRGRDVSRDDSREVWC
jgi:hypothetical protein